MDAFGLPPNKALRTDGAFQNGGSSAGVPPELQALLQSLPPEAQAAAVAAAQALGIPAPAAAAPGSDPVTAVPAMSMSSPFPSVSGQAPTPRVIPPPQRMMQMGSNATEASLVPPGLMGLVPGGLRPAAEWNPAAQGKGAGAWGGKGGWMPPGTQGQLRAPGSAVPPRVIPARSDVPSRAAVEAASQVGGHGLPAAFSAGSVASVASTSLSSGLKRPAPGTGPSAAASAPSVEEAAPVEERQWFYKDAAGRQQGPYPSSVMARWSRSGAFPPETLVRSEDEADFSELGNGMRLTLASLK
ncbi:NEW1 [Symbiodinium microadriaticum]|nr:NEW1 [Symbiodinium microadriaticum]